jgi:SAM-dependent methyltransferase
MRTVACDLCGVTEGSVLFVERDPRAPDGERSFGVVECQGCGLIYLSPRPEGSEMAAYYREEYYDDLGPVRGSERRPSGSLRRRLLRSLLERFYHYPIKPGDAPSRATGVSGLMKTACLYLERLRLRVRGREAAIIPFTGDGRLLDVGCGTGNGLEFFSDLGWHVTGVEMSPYAASMARRHLGCDVLVGEFEEVPLGDESFDVVRFSHNLEHLASPRKALEKARRVLRPAGLLWIEVPNVASIERRLFGRHWFCWDLPRHLYHFTPETLERLLASTGFRPVKIKCDGRVNFFVESLSNVLARWLGIRPRGTKLISAMARPLVYAMGAMNYGGILTVHAEKDEAWRPVSHGKLDRVPGGSGG